MTFYEYDLKMLKMVKRMNFKVEVNEFAWDRTGSVLFVTTDSGSIYVLNGKDMSTQIAQLDCHTAQCYCISMDPLGKWFASGAADALVCVWDIHEMICVKTYTEIETQVRQLSFSFDGSILAAASEDVNICLFNVENEELIYKIKCKGPQHTISWNPKSYVLAYAGEEKDKDKNKSEEGAIHVCTFNKATA
jgi:THO complex subunit 3